MTEMTCFNVFLAIALLLGAVDGIIDKRWRPDWRCGPQYPLADGTPSECNPNERAYGATCCGTGGWCGNTPGHCNCNGCIDYAPKTWRNDWRCGAQNPYSGTKISQCNPDPKVGGYCCSGDGWCGKTNAHCNCDFCANYKCNCLEITNDQYVIVKMDYDLDRAETIMYDPVAAARKIIDNRKGSSSQSVSFSVSEAVSETVSYSHTAGASISSSATFSVGIPFIAEAEISVEVSASYSYSSGKEFTKDKSMDATFQCNGAARKKTFCNVFLRKGAIFVPYRQTWAKKGQPQCTCISEGMFKGVDAVELYMTVDESDKIVARSTKKAPRSEGDFVAKTQE